jgi:hypothetical protein
MLDLDIGSWSLIQVSLLSTLFAVLAGLLVKLALVKTWQHEVSARVYGQHSRDRSVDRLIERLLEWRLLAPRTILSTEKVSTFA